MDGSFINIAGLIVHIITIAYFFAMVYIVGKYAIKDLRKPFLGVSSSFLIAYLVLGIFSVLTICMGYGKHSISIYQIKFFYCLSIMGLYNIVIFYVKKFSFNKVSVESTLTLILEILCFFFLGALAIIPSTCGIDIKELAVKDIFQYYIMLIGGMQYINPIYTYISAIARVIPFCILSTLWYISVTKPYNKNSLNFYPKSANKSLLILFFYQLFLLMLETYSFPLMSTCIFTGLAYLAKLLFYIEVLHWTSHKDMEMIENNMLARAKRTKKC